MIIDNVSDFTHAYLHRAYRPFEDAKLTRAETVADRVHLAYETKVGQGRISGYFVDRKPPHTVPFGEVSGRIEQFLQQEMRSTKTREFVEGLKAKGKVEVLI